ncbi:hypothetical protein J0X19_22090 [Hymenobacter sp. BT186]|uniref:Uncharacterized protein n=1 Tax=Hymenobacter telluris TaxID=2816474 RepID=A0A939F1K4_9BACT|nr:hypothetical protein [Hymenobacter telluris]MBO0360667.1 hypothetical protein [Hymenobacter telluris]MBW3376694.1 hypothetical protein [Hymenobacter norwichensis]
MATGNEQVAVAGYDPYGLRNLQREEALDNLGGLEAVWYTPVSNFNSWPHVGELTISKLDLAPGAVWYQLVSTRGTLSYDQPPKPMGRHGDLFAQKLKGVLARHTAALAAGIETMAGGRFVALYRDLNGQVQLVGTPTEPLTWTDTYSAGSQTARNNYDWQLLGETVRRARPYLGTWSVSGRGLEGALDLTPGAGGTVELRTHDGRLLAIVPAGKSVVLRAGFKLNYYIS